MTTEESRSDRWLRIAADAASSAGEARVTLSRELAEGLAGVVRRARIPLLIVGLLPLIPALLVAIEAAVLGGYPGLVFLAIAVAGASPGLALLWRRRRLLRAADPPEELAAELGEAYDIAGAWARAGDALEQVQTAGPGLRGARQAARGLWAGFQLTRDMFERFSELPRVAPFLPVSLQFTGSLCLASVVSAVVTGAIGVAGLALVAVA